MQQNRLYLSKLIVFKLHIIININRPPDILQSTCNCVAGKGDRAACKHIAALCFALLDYDENKLYEACTERLQQWHHPTRKSSKPMNILDIKFTSLRHNKEEDKPKYLKFLESNIHIPEATTTLCQLLIKYNQQSTAAASILLPQHVTDARIPRPARVINQGPLLSSLQQNLTYICEARERERERDERDR